LDILFISYYLFSLKEKFASNAEIAQLIEDADKNHDDRLSKEETAALLSQIEAKMKQQVSNVEKAEKIDRAVIRSNVRNSDIPEMRLISSSGGTVTVPEISGKTETKGIYTKHHIQLGRLYWIFYGA
jgi:hypothetical protein